MTASARPPRRWARSTNSGPAWANAATPSPTRSTPTTRQAIADAINDDLNIPKAVGILHQANSYRLWREFDPILGLDIEARSRAELPAPGTEELPEALAALAQRARPGPPGPRLRPLRRPAAEIESHGYTVGDSPTGTVVKKNLL